MRGKCGSAESEGMGGGLREWKNGGAGSDGSGRNGSVEMNGKGISLPKREILV